MPYDPKEHVGNTLSVMQPGEVKVCDIKRHPIGILAVYVMSGFIILVVAVVAFGVGPAVVGAQNRNAVMDVGAVVLLFLAALSAIYSFIASRVYWGNTWVVTSDSLTQVTQTSLFNRQSSQLSLGNLEDVTAEQNGILAHMFNYGLLKVETAGERSKFQFSFCPNPNFYAQRILAAREAFEQGRPTQEDNQGTYREQSSYAPPLAASPQPPAGLAPVAPITNPAPQPTQPEPVTPQPTLEYRAPNGSVGPGVNTGTE